MASLTGYFLGRVPYTVAYSLQKSIVDLMKNSASSSAQQCILLLEHFPVYTIGLRQTDLMNDYTQSGITRLKKLGAEFVRSDRGGLITYHGPGQLVAYPIVNLRCKSLSGRGLRWYVGALEQAGVALCAQFGLNARVGSQADTGVWLDPVHKVMSVGIHHVSAITYHGVAINCTSEPLSWLRQIVPCGLTGRDVTSLSEACGRPDLSVADVTRPLFDCLVSSLFSASPVHVTYRDDLVAKAADWATTTQSEVSFPPAWCKAVGAILEELRTR